MKTVTFCFAVHSHQPVGNFDDVIEDAYRKAYDPFFRMTEKYQFSYSAHFSGYLLHWLETHRPEFITRLQTLVRTGRLEIISGGYYEPILPIIPERDAVEQIQMLNALIERLFGDHPHGMWTAERVWEQQIIRPITEAGIRYTMLDDSHFRAAGLDEHNLNGYFETEYMGRTMNVFPISKELRYTIPFQSVSETLRVLHDAADTTGNALVTFADDSEKFGVWPDTYTHVYTDGWLEEFFAKLDENKQWIRTMKCSDALRSHRPLGRIYLPNASYAEMMQWAIIDPDIQNRLEDLTADLKGELKDSAQFVRGGYWRNFFVKYPESYHLYRRMLDVSSKFASPMHSGYDDLLASQCNDTYWHGVFGGIYLPHLRHSAYTHLLRAEEHLFDDVCPVVTGDSRVTNIRNKNISIYFDTRTGAITEIDFLPKRFNVMNYINRHKEAYHRKLDTISQTSHSEARSIHDIVRMKEKDIGKYLLFDPYPHSSFIEHLIDDTMTVEDLAKMKMRYAGRCIETHPLRTSVDEDFAVIESITNAEVHSVQRVHPLLIKKTITIQGEAPRLEAVYTLTNFSDTELQFRFASEWTFGLLSGASAERYFEVEGKRLSGDAGQLRSSGEINDRRLLSLVDTWNGFRIDLHTEEPLTFWRSLQARRDSNEPIKVP